MRTTRAALGLAVVVTVLACEGGRGEPLLGEPPADAGAPFPATPWDASRPARTYYLANRAGRCLLFWTAGTHRSASTPVICPRELGPGEQARLAGSVCMREAENAARSVPIRCPIALVQAAHPPREPK